MSWTDFLTLTGAVTLAVAVKYTPSLIRTWRIRQHARYFRGTGLIWAWKFRRQARRAGLGDLLADLEAVAGNDRNGLIETMRDGSQL